ncbi:IS3 family transposase, partial [Corynebacterium belfantii]|uniref:IS3 family transposase n=1 Tax=Corynebacterium belfantii TaxID=2014537 RepID=UPI002E18010E
MRASHTKHLTPSDNAACEGFFGRMKNEMYYGKRWQTIQELDDAIAAYIEFYNN